VPSTADRGGTDRSGVGRDYPGGGERLEEPAVQTARQRLGEAHENEKAAVRQALDLLEEWWEHGRTPSSKARLHSIVTTLDAAVEATDKAARLEPEGAE
jgi:hypothetical protein